MSLPLVLKKIPSHVTLVAAVKYTPDASSIRSLLEGGVRAIGENRVQDAEAHFSSLADAGVSCEKHFIGTIQSNKIGKIARLFDVVQSLDDREHAEKLDRSAAAEGKILRVLVQINAGSEAQKSGIPLREDKVSAFLRSLSGFSHLRVEGLMAVVPLDEDSRPYFKAMKRLFDALQAEFKLTVLCMGTSDDFEAAIEEGSTMIRVGRLLFD